MRFHHLDLNLLVALDVLLSEANVTRAARRLNMSQTTMSGALQRLRQHFGDELLVQNGRKMTVTPMAQGLRGPVHNIVMQAESVVLRRTAFDPRTVQCELNIMALDAVHAVYTSKVCARVAVEAPGMALSLMNFSSPKDAQRLESNEVQVIIMPSFAVNPHHPSAPLFDETMLCIASRDNRAIRKTLSLNTYLEARHVLSAPHGSRGFESVDASALRIMGHERKVGAMTASFTMMPLLVASTSYLATVPSRLATEAAKTLPLRIFKLPFGIPVITEMLQWNRALEHDPAIGWLRGVMHEVAVKI